MIHTYSHEKFSYKDRNFTTESSTLFGALNRGGFALQASAIYNGFKIQGKKDSVYFAHTATRKDADGDTISWQFTSQNATGPIFTVMVFND